MKKKLVVFLICLLLTGACLAPKEECVIQVGGGLHESGIIECASERTCLHELGELLNKWN